MSIGEQLHLLIELNVLRDVLTSGFRVQTDSLVAM